MPLEMSGTRGPDEVVTVEHDGDVSIVRIHERKLLKTEESNAVAGTLLSAARRGDFRKLLLDFSDVEVVSSAFLGSLVVLHQTLRKQGCPMRIFGLNEALERVFEVAHLKDLFGIDPREEVSRFEIGRQ
jgi:anti-anti-sigma factor